MLPRFLKYKYGTGRRLLGLGLATCLAAGAVVVRAGEGANTTPAKSSGAAAQVNSEKKASTTIEFGDGSRTPSQALVARQTAHLPLAFEPNQGQASAPEKFLAHGNGFSIFLTEDETILALPGKSGVNKGNRRKSTQLIRPEDGARVNLLRMKLVGANGSAKLVGIDELPGKSNYFVGPRERWRTGVPNYRSVVERSIYKGIDFVYYGNQHQLEYDVVLAPGADPRQVRWSVTGAQKLSIDSHQALVLNVDGGKVLLEQPVAYQKKNGSLKRVPVKYVLLGKRGVGLEVGDYDRAQTLVVDPVLSYSTYLGGSNIDGANGIAVASDKTAFIAGQTFSVNLPTAHSLAGYAGSGDAFVSKLSADGSTLLYSAYLGGTHEDTATGIAVDNLGDAYVAGWTISTDFPVTPASFNPECGGDGKCGATFNTNGLIVTNGFVTKLNPEGSGLLYSSYLGFYEHVRILAIAVDSNQVAYVTGSVTDNFTPTTNVPPPPNFPISTIVNPVPTTLEGFGGGATDAFVSTISATGTDLLYSTYVGGVGEDVGYGIATDTSGNAFITGLTYSPTNFPITGGAYQRTYGGQGDAFATELNTRNLIATSPVYSTYLGGAQLDQGNGIALDQHKNMYIAGLTNSSTLTVTPGTARAYAGQGDAFVAKFNPAASGIASLDYFTYLGGSLADAAFGVAVDLNANAYVTGSTVSTDFPTTAGVFQPVYGGGNADAFVSEIDSTGTTLVYSTFLGGTNTDIGYGIGVDTTGSAYVAGQTCSLDFPLSNPEQSAPGGNCDAFVSKVSILTGIALNPAGLVFPPQSLGTTSTPESVTLTDGDNPLTISSIVVQGTDPQDFLETNTCGAFLAAGQKCTITVSFTPTQVGTRTASIAIADSATGSPQVLSLTGTTSTLALSTSNLSFGNEVLGVTSSPVTVTATNAGTAAITISAITASGDFAESDNCTKAPLQPTTNCVIHITYTPTSVGASIGALTLTDNAPGSPQIVLLSGTGAGATTALTLSPSNLLFGNQAVGVTSNPLAITAKNSGTTPITVSGVTASGAFSEADDCTKSALQPATTCTISVTFKPAAAGGSTGAVTVTDSAPGSPQMILLSGIGTVTTVDFSVSVVQPSASVPAGQAATYGLMISSLSGFSQPVNLGCTGLPVGATCGASPNPVTPGASGTPVTLTINTALRASVPPNGKFFGGPDTRLFGLGLLALSIQLALLVIYAMIGEFRPRRRVPAALGFVVALAIAAAGCSPGSSTANTPAGTPAGTYQVTVTGTSGPTTHSVTVNLQVQ